MPTPSTNLVNNYKKPLQLFKAHKATVSGSMVRAILIENLLVGMSAKAYVQNKVESDWQSDTSKTIDIIGPSFQITTIPSGTIIQAMNHTGTTYLIINPEPSRITGFLNAGMAAAVEGPTTALLTTSVTLYSTQVLQYETGTPTSGSFTIGYNGQITSPIDFDATNEEIVTALASIGIVATLTGGPILSGPVTMAMTSTSAYFTSLLAVASNTLSPTTTIKIAGAYVTSGSVTITNHDPSMVASIGAYCVAVWTLNEWIPIHVGCTE